MNTFVCAFLLYFTGRILKIETVPVICQNDVIDPEVIFWSEQVEDEITYALTVRIFYVKCDSTVSRIGSSF